jgi:hypothetical protein
MRTIKNHRGSYHKRGELVDGLMVSKHPLYHTHSNMIDRCLNPNSNAYHNYGARGITVCEQWLSFSQFVKDMGPRPTPFHTIERVDNDDGYHPLNCVWETRTTQSLNRRVFKSNTSGNPGVVKVGNKFDTRFDYKGVRYSVGRFNTLDLATIARESFVLGFMTSERGLHE